MRAVLVLAAIALAGCQSTPVQELSYTQRQVLAKQIAIRCAEQGYPDGNPQQRECIAHEVNREVALRQHNERRRMQLAAGLSAAGDSFTAASRSAPVGPVTCTSTPNSSWVGGPVSNVRTVCN